LLRITQDPTGTTLTFHPLVRGVVRDYMGPDARKFWSDIANRLTLRASDVAPLN
jgi:hypothetical protein